MKSFADTNVWIPAALKPGFSRRVLRRAIDRDIIATTDALITEVLEKLVEKFAIPAAALDSVERTMRRLLIQFTQPVLPLNLCRDPDDDLLLAQALAAGCAYLVTNDKDLLVLGDVHSMRILRPVEFGKLIGVS